MKNLTRQLNDSIKAKKSLIKIKKKLDLAISTIYEKIKNGGKIMLCGNGGSAADAQHLAAEFLVKLKKKIDRKPIPAITLAQDTSTLTAFSNDYNFDKQFARCLEGLGNRNDVLIVISTSGNSKNILNVLKMSKKKKIFSIGFFGNNGGKAKVICDLPLIVSGNSTARVQEAHIFLGHYIFECVENKLLKEKIL
jgi:D-sedoheptulose 7-phosphate isomerase|tara:strand:+ start:193 stop:774 length:582 start_codon:yes stop_codon:yes gene_type:complete